MMKSNAIYTAADYAEELASVAIENAREGARIRAEREERELEEFQARWEAERAWEQSEECAELVAWLDDPANRDHINYSDIYKDVYGIRPRW